MSFGRKLMAVVAAMGMLAGVASLAGCDQVKKENPYTRRTASLDVAAEDHEREGRKLADDQAAADKAAQDARRKALEEAELARQERDRKFQIEFARLQREFAVERARTQATHETSLDELAAARDVDVSKIFAGAKVRADEDVARIVEPITARTQAFQANTLYLRDWERENEERRAKWTLGLDVASAVAGAVPGGGLAQTAIAALGSLLVGGASMTAVSGRRSRKRVDDAYEEGRKVGYEAASKERDAADAAWDESQKRSQPDPNVAAVTSLTSAIMAIVAGKGAPSSPVTPASKDAA